MGTSDPFADLMASLPSHLRGPNAGLIAGIDEAGRGCLAGPVVAAAVILPPDFDAALLPGLTDSKALSAAKREALAPRIRQVALAWGLGLAWPREVDRINILQATLRSMERAVACLKLRPVFLLIDGDKACGAPCPQRTVVGGDALVPAISAASILAKTFRDNVMVKLDHRYPGYGFAGHKGYGAATHLAALRELGASPMHRHTFRGVLAEAERLALLETLRPEPVLTSGKATPTPKQRQSCLPGL
jgi:ribonuclease HII